MKYLTTAKINRAIRFLNLKVIRGSGYFYFLDIDTQDQIGDSVMVASLSQLTLESWIEEARVARMLSAGWYTSMSVR